MTEPRRPDESRRLLTVTISRPIDDVFRVLTTPGDTPRWSPGTVAETLLTPRAVGVGSRRSAVVRSVAGRTTTNETIVTEFAPNRRVAMRSTSSPVPFEAAWSFAPVPGGTRVEWTWSFAFPAPLRLIGPAFVWFFRRRLRQDLERLKAMMEAGDL